MKTKHSCPKCRTEFDVEVPDLDERNKELLKRNIQLEVTLSNLRSHLINEIELVERVIYEQRS